MTSLPLPRALSRTLQQTFAAIALSSAALMSMTASAQSIKAGDIAPFEVVYEVGNNLISAGTARLSLKNENDLWYYSLNTRPKGVFKLAGKGRIDEQSTFRLVESDGEVVVRPQTYSYRQDDERRRAVDATFDWDKQSLTHVYRGEEVTETFTDPIFDRLSATVIIMNALRHDFKSAEITEFDSGRIKQIRFVNEGKETLKTPLGNIETFRVTNRNIEGGSRETTTWFAPSLDYLPVKIEHTKRDELVARLSLLRLENRVTNVDLGKAMPDEDGEL